MDTWTITMVLITSRGVVIAPVTKPAWKAWQSIWWYSQHQVSLRRWIFSSCEKTGLSIAMLKFRINKRIQIQPTFGVKIKSYKNPCSDGFGLLSYIENESVLNICREYIETKRNVKEFKHLDKLYPDTKTIQYQSSNQL